MAKKFKPGPQPLGLAPAFPIRLTEAQEKKARTLAAKRKDKSKAAAVRDALAEVWGC